MRTKPLTILLWLALLLGLTAADRRGCSPIHTASEPGSGAAPPPTPVSR